MINPMTLMEELFLGGGISEMDTTQIYKTQYCNTTRVVHILLVLLLLMMMVLLILLREKLQY